MARLPGRRLVLCGLFLLTLFLLFRGKRKEHTPFNNGIVPKLGDAETLKWVHETMADELGLEHLMAILKGPELSGLPYDPLPARVAERAEKQRLEMAAETEFLPSMTFVTIVNGQLDEGSFAYIKTLVGGLHRLRQAPQRLPKIIVLTMEASHTLLLEEASFWSGVEVKTVRSYLGVDMESLWRMEMKDIRGRVILKAAMQNGNAILINEGFICNPVGDFVTDVFARSSTAAMHLATEYARSHLRKLLENIKEHGHVLLIEPESKRFAAECLTKEYASNAKQRRWSPVKLLASDYGFQPYTPDNGLACFLDVKPDFTGAALRLAAAITAKTLKYQKMEEMGEGVKRLVVGFPTTSKGMDEGQLPAFLQFLIPSLLTTITEEECDRFLVDVYIGFDHGDAHYENEHNLKHHIRVLEGLIGEKPLRVHFIRLPKTGWLSLLWSLLFQRAMHTGQADYFYQVNDDLLITKSGWLTQFTTVLDAHDGFGVVGPNDERIGDGCEVLTQAMVGRRHYDIFGRFYPLELRDWHTDNWITHIYTSRYAYCFPEHTVTNGFSGTRYNPCTGCTSLSLIEPTQKRIHYWLDRHEEYDHINFYHNS